MEKIIRIRGAREYAKFKAGGKLTRKEAMLAQCYQCNGLQESRADCQGVSCPLYQFRPKRGDKEALRAPLQPLKR